jgi:hypothetical protein
MPGGVPQGRRAGRATRGLGEAGQSVRQICIVASFNSVGRDPAIFRGPGAETGRSSLHAGESRWLQMRFAEPTTLPLAGWSTAWRDETGRSSRQGCTVAVLIAYGESGPSCLVVVESSGGVPGGQGVKLGLPGTPCLPDHPVSAMSRSVVSCPLSVATRGFQDP